MGKIHPTWAAYFISPPFTGVQASDREHAGRGTTAKQLVHVRGGSLHKREFRTATSLGMPSEGERRSDNNGKFAQTLSSWR